MCLTWVYFPATGASSAIALTVRQREANARCALKHKGFQGTQAASVFTRPCRSLTLAAGLKNKYSGCRKSLTEYFKLVGLERNSLKNPITLLKALSCWNITWRKSVCFPRSTGRSVSGWGRKARVCPSARNGVLASSAMFYLNSVDTWTNPIETASSGGEFARAFIVSLGPRSCPSRHWWYSWLNKL